MLILLFLFAALLHCLLGDDDSPAFHPRICMISRRCREIAYIKFCPLGNLHGTHTFDCAGVQCYTSIDRQFCVQLEAKLSPFYNIAPIPVDEHRIVDTFEQDYDRAIMEKELERRKHELFVENSSYEDEEEDYDDYDSNESTEINRIQPVENRLHPVNNRIPDGNRVHERFNSEDHLLRNNQIPVKRTSA